MRQKNRLAIWILKRVGLVLISVLVVLEIIVLIQMFRKDDGELPAGADVTPTVAVTDGSEGSEVNLTPGATPTSTVSPTPTLSPTPTCTSTPTPTPTPAYDKVAMTAVGDNLYDWYMLEDGMQEDGSFNFDGYYTNVEKYIALGDFAVVNQETMFGGDEGYIASPREVKEMGSESRWGSYHGFYQFNTPDEVGLELIKSGFNIFTCATNHSFDYGSKALKNMLGFFEKHPEVTYLGIFDSSKSKTDTIKVVEKDGIKLALLNYTYSTGLKEEVKETPSGINVLSRSRVIADIQKARQMADFVIVFPHWGKEYALEANAQQAEYTQLFLEYGVDAVIGAHSHTAQPMERLTRADGHEMVVYYSLGNFISIFKDANCQLEGMAYVEFCKDGDKCYLGETSIIPLVNHWEYNAEIFGQRENFTVYALQDYTEQLASEHGGVNYPEGVNFNYEFINQMAVDMWGENIKKVEFE